MLLETLQTMGPWNWLALAAMLFILEFMVPGFFLFFFGLAAMVVGGLALAIDIPWHIESVLFVILSVTFALIARRLWNPDAASDEPLLNKRGAQYIGHIYTIVNAIENGRGKVKIGDSIWSVSGPDLPAGERVKVVGVEGTMLIVEKMN